MTRRQYDWTPLREVGDFVVVPDVNPRQVSPLAKSYLQRHLGTEVLLATRSTPAGAFVALAHVAERAPATPVEPVYTGPTPAYDHPYDETVEDDDAGEPDDGFATDGTRVGGYSLGDDE